jgi:ferritin-like metal-binding protein YciE
MQLDSLQKLYQDLLKDLHSMERQIIQALPKMVKAAEDPQLKTALSEHLEVTESQLARLDEIFSDLGARGQGKKCKGMEAIIEEGKELLEKDSEPAVLDAGIIAAAQHVEHYEIAGYGTAVAYARLLGEKKAMKLLAASLEEEKKADAELTGLAESAINLEAEMAAPAR